MAVKQLRWTRGSIISFAVTTLAVGALLALLWARLLSASHAAQALPSSPLVGHPAPDFTVTLYNSAPAQPLHLAALRGSPVVVNFWASWCGPCQAEAPILAASWKLHQHDGVVYVGISYEDTVDAARRFVQQYGVPYPTAPDDATGSIAIAYGVTGPPETVFISRAGIVTQKVTGALDDGTLERNIQALLKPAAKQGA